MISSLFYFELSSLPRRCDGRYHGNGFIRCALRRSSPGFQELLEKLGQSSTKLLLDGTAVAEVDAANPSILDHKGEFKVSVKFETADKIAIELKQVGFDPCSISNSPYVLEKLVKAQGLDAVFGTADHGKRKAPDDDHPARKRQRTDSSYIAKP
jgi:hypothetical protein